LERNVSIPQFDIYDQVDKLLRSKILITTEFTFVDIETTWKAPWEKVNILVQLKGWNKFYRVLVDHSTQHGTFASIHEVFKL
jgi:hypothetical protein